MKKAIVFALVALLLNSNGVFVFAQTTANATSGNTYQGQFLGSGEAGIPVALTSCFY